MQEDVLKDTYSGKEVIQLLGIARITLSRWRKSGKIPFVEFPVRTYRYYKTDVEKIRKEGL